MSNFLIHQPQCVFIHIPKTAGTSIRTGYFKGNHSTPVFGYIPEDWSSHFSFAFVRNPYDRLVSAWKMFTVGTERLAEDFPELSLRDFLDIVIDESILYDERRKTYEERIRHHTIPQTHPFNCLDSAQFIGRVENIEKDFQAIVNTLGMSDSNLPRLHYTKREDYRCYYDEVTYEIATKYYADDLEKLNYQF